MKRLFFILLLAATIFAQQMFAQQKKDSCCLSQKDLVGTWQRNHSVVGNGLGQNFEFFDNGTFILNLGTEADDVRGITQLKGKYRLDKDKLYFTITSRTVVDGKIGLADGGISLNLFEMENATVREVQESNPKEFTDPCYITLLSGTHMKLGGENYYKIIK